MTDVERSRRIPIDEAEFEAWLAETLALPTDVPRPALDPRTESLRVLMQHMRETLVPIDAGQAVGPLGLALRDGRTVAVGELTALTGGEL